MGLLLLMALVVAGCGGKPAPATTGNLVIEAVGLPAGAQATVTVTGAAGFNESLAVPGTHPLQAGEYVLSAPSVTHEGTEYDGTPSQTSVTVEAGKDVAVTVTYVSDSPAPVTGTLTVTVNLPAGVDADVTVTSPDSSVTHLTGTESLPDLVPGIYTVSAADVQSSDTLFAAPAAPVLVEVEAGEEAVATIDYTPVGSVVTVVNASGDPLVVGSLPYWLAERASDPDIVAITFDPTEFLAPTEIRLASTVEIEGILTITGLDDATRITLSATLHNDVLLRIEAAAKVELHHLSLTSAATTTDGGAIHNAGDLLLHDVDIHGNSAAQGAGIYNDGTLEITGDSAIRLNNSGGRGGGIYNAAGAEVHLDSTTLHENTGSLGAGIWNGGELWIHDSELTENTASLSGGGIYSSASGDVQITDSLVRLNSADNALDNDMQGGGIRSLGAIEIHGTTISKNSGRLGGGIAVTAGTAHIEQSVITDNTADSSGGGIYNNAIMTVTSTTVADNELTQGNGAGIFNGPEGELDVQLSTISNNFTPATVGGVAVNTNGGGLLTEGEATIVRTTISANWARGGAGISVSSDGSLYLLQSTVVGNSAEGNGGGIFTNGLLEIVNSTITGNKTIRGGGVFVSSGTRAAADISYSTIVANEVERGTASGLVGGGGIYVNGDMRLIGTIVADNLVEVGGSGPDVHVRPAGSGASLGYNLIGDLTDSNFTTIGADGHSMAAGLAALADNGGATMTMLPQSTSYAVNNGHIAECRDVDGQVIGVDQRDENRPQGTYCSIGAVEVD